MTVLKTAGKKNAVLKKPIPFSFELSKRAMAIPSPTSPIINPTVKTNVKPTDVTNLLSESIREKLASPMKFESGVNPVQSVKL